METYILIGVGIVIVIGLAKKVFKLALMGIVVGALVFAATKMGVMPKLW